MRHRHHRCPVHKCISAFPTYELCQDHVVRHHRDLAVLRFRYRLRSVMERDGPPNEDRHQYHEEKEDGNGRKEESVQDSVADEVNEGAHTDGNKTSDTAPSGDTEETKEQFLEILKNSKL